MKPLRVGRKNFGRRISRNEGDDVVIAVSKGRIAMQQPVPKLTWRAG